MTAGRKPRPPKMKLLEGRSPGRDSGGRPVADTPAFVRLPPEKPADLSETASEHWDLLLGELSRLELLKPIDAAALAMVCEVWSRWIDAQKQIREHGIFGVDRFGQEQIRPAVKAAQDAEREYRSWAAEFGLTPSAETKLAMKEASGGEDNPFRSEAVG